jgi:hypothetical protein
MNVKGTFYNMAGVFDKFLKYPVQILLGNFKGEVGWKDISKSTIGNKSVHEIGNDNGIGAVNFSTFKNLTVKGTMFPHHNIHKYTWTFPVGKSFVQQINVVLLNL